MRAMVVYESMFGNTGTIAKALADGLSAGFRVDLVDVAAAPTTLDSDIGLLVVGGPTHAFGLSMQRTRLDAIRQGASNPVADVGVREWLNALHRSPGVAAAAFDTRVDRPRVPGSAARAAARRLRRLGLRIVVAPTSFYVQGAAGPLLPGEVERAQRWAARIVAALPVPAGA
jgi:hypothetical protein